MDRLTSLSVFETIVDEGSLSAAARKLGLSVTMVSKHINALEQRLGVRLLNRTTRKISTTTIGRLYYERAAQLLHDLEEANRMVREMHTVPRGPLTVHANSHLIPWIGPAVSEYLLNYPGTLINLRTGARMPDLVDEGYDLAIRTIAPVDSQLVVKRLADWQQVICCSPSYLMQREPPRQPEDLLEHNCLRYAFFPSGDKWLFRHAVSDEVAEVKISGTLHTDNARLLRDAAVLGTGILIAPGFLLADDLEAGNLIRIMTEFILPSFAIVVLYPHRRYLPTNTRVFIDLLAQKFDQMPDISASFKR